MQGFFCDKKGGYMNCEFGEGEQLMNPNLRPISMIEVAHAVLRDETRTARTLGIDIAFGPKLKGVEPARMVVDEQVIIEQ